MFGSPQGVSLVRCSCNTPGERHLCVCMACLSGTVSRRLWSWRRYHIGNQIDTDADSYDMRTDNMYKQILIVWSRYWYMTSPSTVARKGGSLEQNYIAVPALVWFGNTYHGVVIYACVFCTWHVTLCACTTTKQTKTITCTRAYIFIRIYIYSAHRRSYE